MKIISVIRDPGVIGSILRHRRGSGTKLGIEDRN
jgi:hypothetical protein